MVAPWCRQALWDGRWRHADRLISSGDKRHRLPPSDDRRMMSHGSGQNADHPDRGARALGRHADHGATGADAAPFRSARRHRTDRHRRAAFWGLWALLTPVVVLAVRRWPLDTKPIYRPILLHATISIVIAVVQTALTLGVMSFALYLSGLGGSHVALKVIANPTALAWGAFTGVFFYWLVAAVDSTLRFRR